MRTIILIFLFVFFNQTVDAQPSYSITGLSMEQVHESQIKVNLKVHSLSYGEFMAHTVEINQNVIVLKACYLTTIGASITNLENEFYIDIPPISGNYIFKAEVYSSFTEMCNYQNLDDTATLNFTNPFSGTIALGTNDILPKDKGVKFFPNPSGGIINIQTSINVENVEVFDASGKRVLNVKHPGKLIDLSHLKKGVYFMEILGERRKFSEKIMIQK